MNVTIHKSLPDGFQLARSQFDFVKMNLYEGKGYEVIVKSFIIASPSGEYHEFPISEHSTYSYLEKWVKNNQLYIKK
jgi:hypothetical protein